MARIVGPPPIRVTRLGIMLRVHRQHRYLERIAQDLHMLAQYRDIHVVLSMDRPTPEVLKGVGSIPRLSVPVFAYDSPFPLVGDRERFMEGLQIQYKHLLDVFPGVQAAMIWEDDAWLSSALAAELEAHLNDFRYDALRLRAAFLWDDEETVNDAFPPHWQVGFPFRVYEGDQYDPEWMVHAPAQVARSPHQYALRNRIPNAGYMRREDRERTWRMYKEAGKVDAHSLAILGQNPQLVKLEAL